MYCYFFLSHWRTYNFLVPTWTSPCCKYGLSQVALSGTTFSAPRTGIVLTTVTSPHRHYPLDNSGPPRDNGQCKGDYSNLTNVSMPWQGFKPTILSFEGNGAHLDMCNHCYMGTIFILFYKAQIYGWSEHFHKMVENTQKLPLRGIWRNVKSQHTIVNVI